MTSQKAPKLPQCCQSVVGLRVTSWQCVRRGVIQRGGKWYCKPHDPVARAARYEASFKERMGRHKAEMARAEHNARILHAHEEAVALARAVLRWHAERNGRLKRQIYHNEVLSGAKLYLQAVGSENEL